MFWITHHIFTRVMKEVLVAVRQNIVTFEQAHITRCLDNYLQNSKLKELDLNI